ncbi:MAG: hypothetical protein HYX51_09650 [Chloroflexi bacterium]|nr:hypothetical protein [Chloroflexota bacterium]
MTSSATRAIPLPPTAHDGAFSSSERVPYPRVVELDTAELQQPRPAPVIRGRFGDEDDVSGYFVARRRLYDAWAEECRPLDSYLWAGVGTFMTGVCAALLVGAVLGRGLDAALALVLATVCLGRWGRYVGWWQPARVSEFEFRRRLLIWAPAVPGLLLLAPAVAALAMLTRRCCHTSTEAVETLAEIEAARADILRGVRVGALSTALLFHRPE